MEDVLSLEFVFQNRVYYSVYFVTQFLWDVTAKVIGKNRFWDVSTYLNVVNYSYPLELQTNTSNSFSFFCDLFVK